MSWTLSMSGHIQGEGATELEAMLVDKVGKFVAELHAEYGCATAQLYTQHHGSHDLVANNTKAEHDVTPKATEADPVPVTKYGSEGVGEWDENAVDGNAPVLPPVTGGASSKAEVASSKAEHPSVADSDKAEEVKSVLNAPAQPVADESGAAVASEANLGPRGTQ